jgi:hypothetical protein
LKLILQDSDITLKLPVMLAMASALRQNKEALDASIAQTKSALNARTQQSKAALDASIELGRTDQRVWVGFQNIRLVSDMKPNEDLVVTYQAHNTGRTPALHLVGKNLIGVSDHISLSTVARTLSHSVT